MRTIGLLFLGLTFALTGCSLTPTATPSPEPGLTIHGMLHGGQQPIAGAHVYLFAAGTSGYGGNGIPASSSNASVSVLTAAETGMSDAIGPYVLTNVNGEFTLPDFSCTPGSQVYLYGLGGNPGAGINSSAGLLAALGNCPTSGDILSALPYLSVNEVTTIAAAYAFAGFATDATHVSSSGTPLAKTGIANAFANAGNLVSISTGAALSQTPGYPNTTLAEVVPQSEVYYLANILASCVNSEDSGGSISAACSSLFALALSGGTSGTTPTDTASAAINIAHNPGANVPGLYVLATPASPYPASNYPQPNDFTMMIIFYDSGNDYIAIDGAGDVWGNSADKITELLSTGVPAPGSPFTNYVTSYNGIAIDQSGNVWLPSNDSRVVELSNAGTPVAGSPFTVTGPQSPQCNSPYGGSIPLLGIAIDGYGSPWAGSGELGIAKLNGAETVPICTQAYNGPIAFDSSSNVWSPNLMGVYNAGYEITGLTKISAGGSGASGSPFTGGGIPYVTGSDAAEAIAIDGTGNVWIATQGEGILEFNNSGTPYAGSPFIAGTPTRVYNGVPMSYVRAIAIDGAGNVWSAGEGGVGELSNSGSPATGAPFQGGYNYTSPAALSMAIDGSGNVWIPSISDGLRELIGAAVPVVTPISVGVTNKTLGTRP